MIKKIRYKKRKINDNSLLHILIKQFIYYIINNLSPYIKYIIIIIIMYINHIHTLNNNSI